MHANVVASGLSNKFFSEACSDLTLVRSNDTESRHPDSVQGDWMLADAVLPLLNTKVRIPVCGLIAHYNDTELPAEPDRLPRIMQILLIRRIKAQGFIIFDDYGPRYDEFLDEMTPWVTADKVKYLEDIVDGLEQAPDVLIGLLEGKNFGKLVVRVGEYV